MRVRRSRRLVATLAASTLVLGILAPGTASAAPTEPSNIDSFPAPGSFPKTSTPDSKDPSAKLPLSLRKASGPITVFVRLGMPAVLDKVSGDPNSRSNLKVVVATEKAIETKADKIVAEVDGAAKKFTTTNVIAGVTLSADAEELRSLANNPDVVSIKPVTRATLSNATSASLTRTVETWQQNNLTGKGVRIAVVDTGVDYTHAAFGGPGTEEAFAAAKASATPLYPSDKFEGGIDLVGDDYAPELEIPPTPDANPLDLVENAHGTHVAATAAGLGINKDGTTFTGDFTKLTPEATKSMRIGPGTAPEATIIPIKVFGRSIHTDLMLAGLDEAGRSNADIINLSLGADFSPFDSPENDFIDELSKKGILTVAATGNAGDTTDAGGSAESALAVAASTSGVGHRDLAEIVDPGTSDFTAGQKILGLFSWLINDAARYGLPAQFPTEGELVALTNTANADACEPLTPTEAASVAGKIVFLDRTEDSAARCGDHHGIQYDNLHDAGAIGAIDEYSDGDYGGGEIIPSFQPSSDELTEQFREASAAGVRVLFSAQNYQTERYESEDPDMIAQFSSRGTHGSNGISKPDITAPGSHTFSALVGSGNRGIPYQGTSMSTPHVAGIAALVLQQHQDWSPAQIKSALMNTATKDVVTGPYSENVAAGINHGPFRTGAGRVVAKQAVETPVIAYDTASPSAVTSTFGVLEVGDKPLTQERQITVENLSDTAHTLKPSFAQASEIVGAKISVTPSEISVPAHGKATVTVTFTVADPTKLRKTLDPTMDPQHPRREDVMRDYVPAVSGRVILTPSAANSGIPTEGLRVPVTATVRPSSDMRAAGPVEFADKAATLANLTLNGRSLKQGPLQDPTSYNSVITPLELVAVSPKIPNPEEVVHAGSALAGDIEYVGISSAIPQIAPGASDSELLDKATVQIGVSTYHAKAALDSGSAYTSINIDTNKDGVVDYITFIDAGQYDTPIATTITTEPFDIVSETRLNGVLDKTDSNTFDTNTVSAAISLADIGFSADQIRANEVSFNYSVVTTSENAVDPDWVVDSVTDLTYSATTPGLWFGTQGEIAASYSDEPGLLQVNRLDAAERSILLLHLHNASGKRAEVVPTKARGDAAITLSQQSVERGKQVTIQGTGYDAGSTVDLTLRSTPAALGTAQASADGTFTFNATIPANTMTGKHTIVAVSGQRTASAEIVITAPGDNGLGSGKGTATTNKATPKGTGIAVTGAHIAALIALAVLLSAAGIVLLRKRKLLNLK